jgi:hypothetical protein
MTEEPDQVRNRMWEQRLDEVDREVAKLATICNVRILEPGVIERVLKDDASVCGTKNPAAFKKLREILMIHYHVRGKAVGVIGEAETAHAIERIVERLRARIGGTLGTPRQG